MSTDPIVCPFCPLCCDDVRVDDTDGTVDPDCDLARRQFDAAINPMPARIGAKTIDATDWNAFKAELSLPDSPMIEINGASIDEAKAIEALVQSESIQINFTVGVGSAAIDQTIARDGVIAATLGEVCARSDLIWVVGDIDSCTPRLAERLSRSSAESYHTPVLTVEMLSRLHSVTGQWKDSTDLPRDPAEPLLDLVRTSRYTSIVVGESPFEQDGDLVASELLVRLIARWNDLPAREDQDGGSFQSRAVMLRINHNQNLLSVMRWRNNRISPAGLSTPASPSIRIGSRCREDASPVRLQIGGIDPGQQGADAYLPASTPGIHFPGTTIRGDGSVTLPLGKLSLHSIATAQHSPRIDVLRRVLGDS